MSNGGRGTDADRLTAILESLSVSPGMAGELRSLLAGTFTAEALERLGEGSARLGAGVTGGAVTVDPGQPLRLPERYDDRGPLGRGGMGEVRRVYDTVLHREVALKVVRADVALSAGASARFVAEARATAALAHPGIVPVYDHGLTPDGRPYFTMQEVRGATFGELIARIGADPGDVRTAFRRLVDALERAAGAVAYAHARGVVHRDIKPANLLVGEHGEVRVVDWGLFRPDPSWDGPPALIAAIAGTPAYMAPEQARGDIDQIDARTDVYALGCVLWQMLSGRAPFAGVGLAQILAEVAAGRTPGRPVTTLPGVDELCALAEWCLRAEAAERPADAERFAAELRRWLDGETRRDRARVELDAARQAEDQVEPLRERAAAARASADALLGATATWEPDTAREAYWRADDEANALARAVAELERSIDASLEAAMVHDPDAVDVRAVIAARARKEQAAAEATRDGERAAVAELRLRRTVDALPVSHPERARSERWLRGDGALTLHTEPAGALAVLHRYDVVRRRLVPVVERELGRTPLDAVSVPRGRWLVTLAADGCETVRYPIALDRLEHWHGVPPGASEPAPIRLPRVGELGADERYVPAGWANLGGDTEAPAALSARRVWVDGFVARRFVVTNADWLRFLAGLVDSGDPELASRCAPRDRGRSAGTWGDVLYGVDAAGRYALRTDAEGVTWQPDWPVIMVDHVAAWTYARFEAARTGLPWRLPAELEWEKAARGTDGRTFPWGDAIDPSWCGIRPAFRGAPLVEAVTERPVDDSPYGVRGMAGHVVEWTADRYRPEGTTVDGERVQVSDGRDDGEEAWADRSASHRIVGRGGSRAHDLKAARACFRLALDPWGRGSNVGVRVVRSFGHDLR